MKFFPVFSFKLIMSICIKIFRFISKIGLIRFHIQFPFKDCLKIVDFQIEYEMSRAQRHFVFISLRFNAIYAKAHYFL